MVLEHETQIAGGDPPAGPGTSVASDLDRKYFGVHDDGDESHMLALGLISGARRVLEIGAATGYLSELMTARGSTVVAVELDATSAAIAASRGVDVRVGHLEDVVRKGETFDCVALIDVIEHVPDPKAFLASCLRYLTPGGTVVVSVPNVAHWSVRCELLSGRFDYTRTGLMDDTHLRFFTAASLERLLVGQGLTIVERKYSLGLYAYPKWTSMEWQWQRRKLVRKGVARWPGLFAYQFVWKAVFPGTPAEVRA